MSGFNLLPLVGRAWRRRRLVALMDDLQAWEEEGRGLLAQVLELTDPEDDLATEARRILETLGGP